MEEIYQKLKLEKLDSTTRKEHLDEKEVKSLIVTWVETSIHVCEKKKKKIGSKNQ